MSRESAGWKTPISLALTVIPIFLASLTWANPGDWDYSFGDKGKVLANPCGTVAGDNANALTVKTLKSGKILVGGTCQGHAVLLRYSSDGVLDQTFADVTFREITRIFVPENESYILALYRGQKDLAPGAIVRYHPDGSLDLSFGNNGYAYVNDNSLTALTDIVQQSNGEIVVVGMVLGEPNTPSASLAAGFQLWGFHADGSPNNAVNSSPTILENDGENFPGTPTLALQSDDKIILGAFYKGSNGFGIRIYRMTQLGSLDKGFGDLLFTGEHAGYASIDPSWGAARVKVASQSDGKIVVATGTHLFRLNADGSIDQGFGNNGVTAAYASADSHILISSTDQIIINSPAPSLTFSRFTKDGMMDPTFGSGGTSVGVISAGSKDTVNDMSLQADGKIVAVGYTSYEASSEPIAIAIWRFEGDALLNKLIKPGSFLSVCGDGKVEGTEQCDLGKANGLLTSTCSSTCTKKAAIILKPGLLLNVKP